MLLARLVTGRYGNRTIDEQLIIESRSAQPGWMTRLLSALFGRKSPA